MPVDRFGSRRGEDRRGQEGRRRTTYNTEGQHTRRGKGQREEEKKTTRTAEETAWGMGLVCACWEPLQDRTGQDTEREKEQ